MIRSGQGTKEEFGEFYNRAMKWFLLPQRARRGPVYNLAAATDRHASGENSSALDRLCNGLE